MARGKARPIAAALAGMPGWVLPEGKFSYLLQDWDQALAVENPYGQVDAVLARILGRSNRWPVWRR